MQKLAGRHSRHRSELSSTCYRFTHASESRLTKLVFVSPCPVAPGLTLVLNSVDHYISTVRLSSTVGTFRFKVTEPPASKLARREFITRVTRYVSPFPWGSLKAELGRKSERLDRLAEIVWSGLRVGIFVAKDSKA